MEHTENFLIEDSKLYFISHISNICPLGEGFMLQMMPESMQEYDLYVIHESRQ